MAAEEPQGYDVIVVDAFSSDAIPVHLLTSQAVEVYRRHLAPGGIMAFHVSNHFLDLAPVVKQEADHAGLHALFISIAEDDDEIGEFGSDWVLVTANQDFLSRKELGENESTISPRHGLRLWTDDYNSVLPVLKWSEPKESSSQ